MTDAVKSLSGKFCFAVQVSQACNNDCFSMSEKKTVFAQLKEQLLTLAKPKPNLVMFFVDLYGQIKKSEKCV